MAVDAVPDLVIVSGEEDWEGVYVNGRLAEEGHTLEWSDVLNAAGVPYRHITVTNEWMEKEGRLPASFFSIPLSAEVES